jgi:hypothetical protein
VGFPLLNTGMAFLEGAGSAWVCVSQISRRFLNNHFNLSSTLG